MAKLNRFTMPVFAGNAAQNQTSVFGTMKTSPQYTTDVAASIGTAAYGNGWADAIDLGYAPFMEDMNTLQRAITYQIAYNQQQGIPEWASDTTYYKDSLVKYNTGSGAQIYASLANNNVGNLLSDTTKWKLVLDTANSYVTINTTETITGAKTFTKNIDLTNNTESYRHISSTNTAITKGTTPSTNTGMDFLFKDSQNSFIGSFSTWYNTGGVIRSGFRAFAPTAESTGYGELVMDSTETGSQLSFITYNGLNNTNLWGASSDTSRNLVALQGWVNNPSMSTNVVHRSGNETIDGAKTFNESPNFKKYILSQTTEVNSGITAQKTDVTKGTAPADNYNNRVLLQSKDGTTVNQRLASLDLFYHTENMTSAVLSAYKPEFDSTTRAIIGVYYPASGDPYTYCPASDVANSIVTTVNKNKSANGYFQLGNGLIVQWGRLQIHVHTDKTVYTITLPKAFTSTNYTFCTCFENNTSSSPSVTDDVTFVTTSISTTQVKGFGFDAGNNYYDAYIRWIAIGY